MTSSPNLDEEEARVRSEIIERERPTLAVIEDLINQHLAGFQQSGSFTPTEDNRLQQVWFLLKTRAFNTLRWAYHLLQTGYYGQSMMLTRGAFEDWLVCEDSKEHPETIDALFDRTKRFPRFSTMAGRLGEPHRTAWQGIEGADGPYDLLSTFSHPRFRAVATLFARGSSTVRLGPFWDEDLFVVSANYLTQALLMMLEFTARLVPPDSEWFELAHPAMDQGYACREELLGRATARLEEL